MRWIIVSAATVATCLGRDGNFSGTVFDLETGRTQVISGNVDSPPKDTLLDTMRRINAEMAESNARLSAEISANDQLYEMRKQTRILEQMSKDGASGSSASYVPPATYTPRVTVYTPPKSSAEEDAAWQKKLRDDALRSEVMGLAQNAKSFNENSKRPRDRQLSAKEGAEHGQFTSPDNEEFIEGLLQGYQGTFTDYRWTMEKVDEQTYFVKCHVLLDGEASDFQFRVNLFAKTCRYEGGTALDKLSPPIELSNEVETSETWGENDPVVSDKTGPADANWWDKYKVR